MDVKKTSEYLLEPPYFDILKKKNVINRINQKSNSVFIDAFAFLLTDFLN